MKSKLVFLVWSILGVNGLAYAQNTQLKFEKVKYSLSDLPKKYAEGDSIHVSFKFVNKGLTSIRILGVDSSCTCTIPTYTKSEIEPGGKGEVILTTTFDQLSITRSVFAVVMSNTKERYYKLTLEW